MNTKNEFKVFYDTTPNDVVDKISSNLQHFGLKIITIEEGDGFIVYKIVSA